MSSNTPQSHVSNQKTWKHNKIFSWFRKFYYRQHLDFVLQMLLFLGLFIGLPSYLVSELQDLELNKSVDREFLLDFASTMFVGGGLFFTAKSLHSQYHYQKETKASEYVSLWYGEELAEPLETIKKIKDEEFDSNPLVQNSPSIICNCPFWLEQNYNLAPSDVCNCLVLDLKQQGIIGINQTLSKIQSKILARLLANSQEAKYVDRIFNFFEQIGEDIRLNVADRHYLKDFFYMVIINYYELFRKYIEYKQRKVGNKFTLCNFVYLAHHWEKQLIPPEIPEICQREWWLTKDEYTAISQDFPNASNSNKQDFSPVTVSQTIIYSSQVSLGESKIT